MSAPNNPGINYLKRARLTPQEEFDLMLLLMNRYEQHQEPVEHKKRKAGVVHHSATIESAKKLLITGDEVRGLKSGYHQFDEMTRGLNPSEILVLFATPGVGKSQVAQNIALNIVGRGEAVLFIGLEMTNDENETRFMQMYGPDAEGFKALPLLYPESNDLKFEEIDGVVEAAKGEKDIKLVVVDHLHMFDFSGARTEAEAIANIMKELKRVTRKHNVPMILVAHVNRGADGIPKLRDLLGSSAIEQIADIAITLWKDPNADDMASQPLTAKVRKQRKGWKRETMKFYPDPNGTARLSETQEVALSDMFPDADKDVAAPVLSFFEAKEPS